MRMTVANVHRKIEGRTTLEWYGAQWLQDGAYWRCSKNCPRNKSKMPGTIIAVSVTREQNVAQKFDGSKG